MERYLVLRFGLLLALAILFSGCAQPEPPGAQISNFENNFQTGLQVVTDYVTDGERTFVVLEINNPREKTLDIWMVHIKSAIGMETTSKSRFYTGNIQTISQTFRLPRLAAGVEESISFLVMDINGEVLFETKPITYTQKEGEL